MHISTLFPDSVIKRAEEEIAHYENKGHSSGARGKGRYHSYERTEKRSDRKSSNKSWIDQHGRILAGDTTRKQEENLLITPRDQPRASSPINDKLQEGLLAGSQTSTQRQTMNTCVNFHVVKVAHTAPGHSQRKEISPGSPGYVQKEYKLKYLKGVFYVTQLSCVKPVTNVKNAASNLPIGARLQNYWQTWHNLGAGPKVVQILREGYTLPFRIRPNLSRSPTVISCYVNPRTNLYLLEALHQLIDKNAVELVHNQRSLGFLTISSAQTQQQVETYTRSEQAKSFPQGGKIQNGDTGNHQDIPPTRGGGYLSRLQGRLLQHTNTGTIQEISEIPLTGSDIPVQGTAIRFGYSTHGVHCSSKGGETDGHTQWYKDPPVPRRLVDESQIPPGLSPAYTRSSENVPKISLAGEFRKIRTGAKADHQWCRLPVRSQVWPGLTDTRPVAKPSRENTETAIPTGLSGLTIHVLDRFTNSHRKASSLRLTAYETHTVASQK